MYNEDHRSQNRMGWSYRYKGRELLPVVRRRYAEYQRNENQAREKMAIMIKDPSTFHDDRELQKVKGDIDRLSAVREQLEVQLVEFKRDPERDYNLHLSDVVFYGLHLKATVAWLRASRKAWKKVRSIDKELEHLRTRYNSLQNDQDRLARILGVLQTGAEEGALRLRYVERLAELHQRTLDCEAATEKATRALATAKDTAWATIHQLEAPPESPPRATAEAPQDQA